MISQRNNISYLVAKLLNIRNIHEDKINQFLNPKFLDFLPQPFTLKDMNKSIERIYKSIIKKKLIGIIADYDVDGSTSAAILCKFLISIKQNFILKIPDRLHDGYGPNKKILDEFKKNNVDLILTLDCGTTAFDILDKKKYPLFDIIVIDHHISEKILPNVFSIINPNRFDENNEYKDLAAVGVTFLFILALRKKLRICNFFKNSNISEPNLLNYLDLVALGTVCDVVSLTNFNRALVSEGIKIIHKRKNKGITSIIDNSNINNSPTVSDLSYIIGPQLNAASRIDNSFLASKLLMSDDIIEIESISRKLFILNEKRKLIESNVFNDALNQAVKFKESNVIIVKGEGWHQGILGIVASKILEKFNKPTIVISYNNKFGIGSARSIPFIDIGNEIIKAKNNGLLITGGGHKLAAGLKLNMKDYDNFFEFIISSFKKFDSSYFRKIIYFDLILSLPEINTKFLDDIEMLEPYGVNNPEPKFILKNVQIDFAKIIKEKHVLINTRDNNDILIKGICFNCVHNSLGQNLLNYKTKKFDLGCSIKKDVYQGSNKPQMIIHDAILIN